MECQANTRVHASHAFFALRSNSTRRHPFQEWRRRAKPASRYFPTYSEIAYFPFRSGNNSARPSPYRGRTFRSIDQSDTNSGAADAL